MKSIRLSLNQNPYDILLEQGGLESIGGFVRPLVRGKNACVVTDENVAPLYFKTVKNSFEREGFRVVAKIVKAGEKFKTTATYLDIIDTLGKDGFLRDDVVVALGGGVVGDMAGFAAATYMRGISLVQVPTTLLSQIDSSIGGKVGVDLEYGKNLLGAFYQPKLVFVDVDTLSTLPRREWENGLGEGLKYAILDGGRLFEIISEKAVADHLEEFVSLCAGYKARIVEQDEKELGLRRLLNLGHTLGHAIEKKSDFEIPHGEAVKFGLAFILQASKKLDGADVLSLEKGLEIVSSYGGKCPFEAAELLSLIRNDKKAEDAHINAVFAKGIGECFVQKMTFNQFKSLF